MRTLHIFSVIFMCAIVNCQAYGWSLLRSHRENVRSAVEQRGHGSSLMPATSLVSPSRLLPISLLASLKLRKDDTSDELSSSSSNQSPGFLRRLFPISRSSDDLSSNEKLQSSETRRSNHPQTSPQSSMAAPEVRDEMEPSVEFSDLHPVYVKPPSDFKPVLYPSRKMDGISVSGSGDDYEDNGISGLSTIKPEVNINDIDSVDADEVTLATPSKPYPYKYPNGVSSWLLGGPRGVERGGFWESLASDLALGGYTGDSGNGDSDKLTAAVSNDKKNTHELNSIDFKMAANQDVATAATADHPARRSASQLTKDFLDNIYKKLFIIEKPF